MKSTRVLHYILISMTEYANDIMNTFSLSNYDVAYNPIFVSVGEEFLRRVDILEAVTAAKPEV